MDTLASEVGTKRRSQLNVSGRNFNGHASPVHGGRADADVLHTLGRNVGSCGLERSPAESVLGD